jgi:hypothetical protein
VDDGEDDPVSTMVVPVMALAYDFAGWVPAFDRSRAHRMADAGWIRTGDRECTATVTMLTEHELFLR